MVGDWAILQNQCRGLIDPFGLYTERIFEVYRKEAEVSFAFKIEQFFCRLLRKLHLISEIPQSILWNNAWKKMSHIFDTWVIFYDSYAEACARYIKRQNPVAKIYAYSWDIHFIPSPSPFFTDIGTFDIIQAKHYGLCFYAQFYAFDTVRAKTVLTNRINVEGGRYRFVFCGLKKNRESEIEHIKTLCDKVDANSLFLIVDHSNPNAKGIPYLDYLSFVQKSECIVDVVIEGQSGLSLRPMEALFFNKKLITNNVYIKNMDFYMPENIFIYGIDTDLKSFMSIPLCPVPDAIKNRYLLQEWINCVINP